MKTFRISRCREAQLKYNNPAGKTQMMHGIIQKGESESDQMKQ